MQEIAQNELRSAMSIKASCVICWTLIRADFAEPGIQFLPGTIRHSSVSYPIGSVTYAAVQVSQKMNLFRNRKYPAAGFLAAWPLFAEWGSSNGEQIGVVTGAVPGGN
jgi:hypothetical protein